ncbi:DUF4347 domain-containing protein [Spirulina major CS-329]|uniref:DUF4347 domain-containing protein n=1 Tax=Spirulina TaxID=1154 RepID=UPI00232C8A14|nr:MULTISPECIES: DUF4347 domain-containing protein [Spirulina]MDB9494185.1 DUF4347 domain-containing protein [Spirulina subsalsa CS-330]MDB9505316.1 DUF4347 domain-containing protein [Spirulina major CS-329]
MNTATLINRSLSNRTGQGMLVILDAAVPHRSHLEAGLLPGATLLTLDRDRDGIAQITDYLRAHSGFTSLHLISHGAPGRLDLGSAWVDRDSLAQYQDALASWRTAFSDRFELLLYGCQVGHGAIGRDFVEQLGQMTGAIVAANPSYTGSSNLGGTWNLSTQTAPIQSAIAIAPATQITYSALLATYTAANASELIAAINTANGTIGVADTIELTAGSTFDLTTVEFSDLNGFGFGPTGLPLITDEGGGLIIRGLGGSRSTIRRTGSTNFRIFSVYDGGVVRSSSTPTLTLENVIVSGGRAVFDNNFSLGDDGAGILNIGGSVLIKNSSIQGNTADDDGGGILNASTNQNGAILTIEDSEVTNNTVTGSGSGNDGLDDGGAGIASDSSASSGGQAASLTLTNVTVTGNTATTGSGGGIQVADGGSISLEQVSITGNNSANFGAGIAFGDTNVPITITKIVNSTIKNNAGNGQDIQSSFHASGIGVAPVIPSGANLVGNDIPTTATATSGSNIPGIPENPVNPTVLVNRTDNSSSTRINDGDTITITVEAGATLLPFAFRIRNGGQNDLDLTTLPTSSNNTDFIFTLDTPAFLDPLPGTNTVANGGFEDYSVLLSGSATAADVGKSYSTDITFTVNDPANVNGLESGTSDGIFNFTLITQVVEGPVVESFLSFDSTNKVFTTGAGDGNNVKLTVAKSPAGSLINDLKITYLDAAGNVDSQLFSVLTQGELPNGFSAGLQTFILDNVNNASFVGGEQFMIEVNGASYATQVSGSNGVFNLAFDSNSDGVFNDFDLQLQIEQVNELIPRGVGTTQANGLEVIDLLSVGGNRTATFNLFREATFNNTVGLYRIDGVNGAVNGVLPGAAGYAREAIANRVSGINLAVGNGATASASGNLTGGALYAPFIIVDSSVDAYLSGGGGEAYFSYASANADGADHVILLGNNTFGFEDLVGGGDRDFNDLIFQVDIV